MKKFLYDVLQKLGIFFLLNLAVILVYFLVWLVFKIPVINELTDRFIDIKALDTVLYLLYGASYYVFASILICKNPSTRAAYLNATANEDYSFKRDVKEYIRAAFASDILASTALSLIAFLILGVFNTNKFFRLVFLPEYSLSYFMGTFGAAVFYAIFTAAFVFIVTVSAQFVWNRKRLGGKAQN